MIPEPIAIELSKLKPNICKRFMKLANTAFRNGFTFGVHIHSDTEVDITPISLPDPKDTPLHDPGEEALTNFRLIQIERLGIEYGVFRPVGYHMRNEHRRFTAYDLDCKPLPADLLKDRLAQLSHA